MNSGKRLRQKPDTSLKWPLSSGFCGKLSEHVDKIAPYVANCYTYGMEDSQIRSSLEAYAVQPLAIDVVLEYVKGQPASAFAGMDANLPPLEIDSKKTVRPDGVKIEIPLDRKLFIMDLLMAERPRSYIVKKTMRDLRISEAAAEKAIGDILLELEGDEKVEYLSYETLRSLYAERLFSYLRNARNMKETLAIEDRIASLQGLEAVKETRHTRVVEHSLSDDAQLAIAKHREFLGLPSRTAEGEDVIEMTVPEK